MAWGGRGVSFPSPSSPVKARCGRQVSRPLLTRDHRFKARPFLIFLIILVIPGAHLIKLITWICLDYATWPNKIFGGTYPLWADQWAETKWEDGSR